MAIYVEAKDGFDWANSITTFLSVILGAALAYFATRLSERRKERGERVARATIFFLKFRDVVDGIFKVDRQIREGMQDAQAQGVNGPAWTQISEIAGIGDYEEHISIEDLSIVAEFGHYDLIEGATELSAGHNGVLRALVQLYRLRNELANVMPPQQMQGQVAVFAGVPPAAAGPLIANLNILGADILNHLGQLKAQAREVVPQVNEKLKSSLKVKKFPRIEIPAEN